MLPGDRAPAQPTQYAGEPTFLCLGMLRCLATTTTTLVGHFNSIKPQRLLRINGFCLKKPYGACNTGSSFIPFICTKYDVQATIQGYK